MDQLDELTGVYQRTAFLEKLDQALVSTASNRKQLVLILMDIDHFRLFNETFGHVAGDAAIQAFGQRLAEAYQQDSLVGRYGGDEFIAAVTTTRPLSVLEKGEELCRSIAKTHPVLKVDGQEIACDCTISLGMAVYPDDGANPNDLIDKAKQALYHAKDAGGKSVYLYEQKDGLTGLFNRNAIVHQLEAACAKATKERETFSVVLFDIDQFEQINVEYGHRFGDEVLKRLSTVLMANFNDGNFIGRFGGDEFIVVLPGCQAETAFVLAEEVRKVIEDSEITIVMGSTNLTKSFQVTGGVATFPADASEWVDLIRKADEALYRAKRTGKNRICLPSSAQMITKTSYYTQTQLERLAALAKKLDKSEAFLLREALDDLLRKFDESTPKNK
jgi:diguanylate cyclase (GGDEF)-like protein